VNESYESNNKMIEEILAKEREEMARTLEERDAEHKADIEEINSQNKEEFQNLNAKHEAAFAAEILQLQEQHKNEIRMILTEYEKETDELRARIQQVRQVLRR
jgi:uncharacterized protein YdbL (DUF1318 family)